jgi:ubiquinone/menaquinone biosynthesis C-methylase UbiE
MKIIELTQVNRTKTISGIYRKWIKGKSLLDVGCGDGIIIYNLSKNLNIAVTGCDILKYTIKPIKFKLMEKVDRLPFPNHSFDTVSFNDVLHHTLFPVQETLIAEAIRVARKNIIIFELKPTIGSYFQDFVLNKIEYPAMHVPLTLRSPKDWARLFAKFDVHTEIIDIPMSFPSFASRVAFNLKI